MTSSTKEQKFDVVVIGSGPGGYVCAIRAAQLGLKVGVIESSHLGGICLNWGCIPTKALLKSAEVVNMVKKSEEYGVKVSKYDIDFQAIIQRSRAVSEKLSGGIGALLKKNDVKVVNGFGKITGKGSVDLYENLGSSKPLSKILASHIVVATGAKARTIPGFEPDGKVVWTYKEAMKPPSSSIPKKLCVVGSGAIGVEFANFYQSLGSSTVLLEAQPRILPAEDEEISKLMLKCLKGQGMRIETGIKLDGIAKQSNACTIGYNGKKDVFDAVIMAVGVVPNTENIGLASVGAELENSGHIVVDSYLQTKDPSIFAIGDVVAGPWLAHKASHEGIVAAEKIATLQGKYSGNIHPVNKETIPGCIYTFPQVASVGLTEKQARDKGVDIRVGRFSNIGNGKSIAAGNLDGLCKVIFDRGTGEIVGAHLCGAEVTELISHFSLAKVSELTENELIQTVFPHPTVSEMLHEAVLDAYDRCIHM